MNNIPLQLNEVIAPIQGYEGLYSITSFGRVYSHERRVKWKKTYRCVGKKFLKSKRDKKGYLCLNLSKNKKVKTFRVHRLVAQHYIPNPLNLPEVNHKDTIKQNNYVSNLEWCTDQENQNHATVEGLRIKKYSKYYGVTYYKRLNHKRKPWNVRIRINKKKKHIGFYKTELEAVKAYNAFVIESKLNRPLNEL